MTASTELIGALSGRGIDDLPGAVVREAKRLILDFLGVGLAGSRTESGRIACDFALEMAGPGEASLIGRSGRVAAVHAAFANAISSHSVELDDVDELALFHHGPPIVAAALAAAEAAGRSGADLVVSIVAGCETMTRLSQATNNSLRDRGFHTTPTCGVFGATIAAGILLGLSDDQMVSALGLAGAQASGLMEMYGPSMQKRFNPGPAARNGVTSALMARAGFTGSDTIIDGERGFAAAFAGHFDRERFIQGLGRSVPMTVEYKPYSCARPIHNVIDAMLELRAEGLRADEVKEITVKRHPDWAFYHLINEPRTFHEAQVSMPYSAALALVEGQALPAQYAQVGQNDIDVMNLSRKIVAAVDESLSRGVSCHVVVQTTDGRQFDAKVDYPLGSVQRPLSDLQLAEKFTSLASDSIGIEGSAQVVKQVGELETAADVTGLTRILGTPAGIA